MRKRDFDKICQDVADLFLAQWARRGEPVVDIFQFDEEVARQIELSPEQGVLEAAWRMLGRRYKARENPLGVFQFPAEALRRADALVQRVPTLAARLRDKLLRLRLAT